MGVRVYDILSRHSGCCLDNEFERRKVARAVERAIAKERCDDCDHEFDVHNQPGGCLGGPGEYTTCNCKGFRKEKR